jgi:hypothetical protein
VARLDLASAEFRLAPSGMAWKGADSEGVIAMAAPHIDWVQWLRVARSFQLRVGVKDSDKREHRVEKFDGFAREVWKFVVVWVFDILKNSTRITIN